MAKKSKSKSRKPTLLNQKRKSAAEELFPHLKSALATGTVLAKGIKGSKR